MNLNKVLFRWMIGIFGTTFLMIGAVVAYDRDMCGVDHLFDFHIDTDRMIEDGEREYQNRKDNDRRHQAFVDEVRDFGRDDRSNEDRGLHTPPDRDK
jgi:hypothetical protein